MGKILIVDGYEKSRLLLLSLMHEIGIEAIAVPNEAAAKPHLAGCDLIFADRASLSLKKDKPLVLVCTLEELRLTAKSNVSATLTHPIDRETVQALLEKLLPLGADIIAKSPQMLSIIETVHKVAASDASVFITGESGTGKEVIANLIHSLSPRKKAPFICVNCAALPGTLIESEFFGHEKGSFTGALLQRIGRFELADHGTLLLDEISEVPLAMQAKLLRAVQEREFERVGGMRAIRVNVRFIATSNRDVEEAIANNQFREDLYYRLNVIPLHLPPLRERPADILPLAHSFLPEGKHLTQEAQEKLLTYHWPGNIRELSNAIAHAAIMSSSDHIDATHFSFKKSAQPITTLAQVERRHIEETLKNNNYNKTHAAKKLDISVRTLRNKLAFYSQS